MADVGSARRRFYSGQLGRTTGGNGGKRRHPDRQPAGFPNLPNSRRPAGERKTPRAEAPGVFFFSESGTRTCVDPPACREFSTGAPRTLPGRPSTRFPAKTLALSG